jgi:DNA polymerase-3 subunit beta
MQTITIKRNALRAMLHMAGDHDVRYYLNGVLVEANATATRLVATDGSVLGAYEHAAPKENPNNVIGVARLILPRETVALLKADRHALPLVSLMWDETAAGPVTSAELSDSGQRLGFVPIDGKFPDYAATIPAAKPSGMGAWFNVDLLARFVKVAKLLGASRPGYVNIAYNGPDHAAAVTLPGVPRFAGVIMPLRRADPYPVEWAARALRPAGGTQPESIAA